MTAGLWDRETFVEKLREIGACAYHDKHPFHVAMNEGRLSPEALRGWVANRFYYQRCIPVKDAAILSNCPLHEVRRVWIHRIVDHDGTAKNEGGIEAWLRLGEACGLSRDELMQDRHVRPGVRFAVDAYVNFARNRPWPVAIASSLTELFAPDLMAARLGAFEKSYPWIDPHGLDNSRILARYPLKIGAEWKYTRRPGKSGQREELGSAKFVAYERITVPAGTFACFRVDAEASTSYRSYSEQKLWNLWYCPDIKWIAKERVEVHTFNPGGPPSSVMSVSELEKYTPGPQ